MRSVFGNKVVTLKDQIVLLYYKKGKRITGPYCKFDLEKITAFVESVRDHLIFDVFEKIIDYYLLNVSEKSVKSCFSHMPVCFNYTTKRSHFKRIYNIKEELYGRLVDFKYESTRGFSRFNNFTFYLCSRYTGYKILIQEDDHILDQLDIEKLCYFNVEKDVVWVKIDPGAIICKWF